MAEQGRAGQGIIQSGMPVRERESRAEQHNTKRTVGRYSTARQMSRAEML